jgi:hypothetical protein
VAEEELGLLEAIRPRPATRRDAAEAAGAVLVVVTASVVMERSAVALGTRLAVPQIVTGALVLAAATSLPNAVATVYLAARGRGAATLSTALNSNTLNVTAGLLIPGAVIGLARPAASSTLTAAWYAGLTVAALAFAYRDRGLGRPAGVLIVAAYLAFARAPGSGLRHARRQVRPGVSRPGAGPRYGLLIFSSRGGQGFSGISSAMRSPDRTTVRGSGWRRGRSRSTDTGRKPAGQRMSPSLVPAAGEHGRRHTPLLPGSAVATGPRSWRSRGPVGWP